MFQQQRRQDISMDNLVFSLPSLDTSHAGSDRAADDIGSNSVAPALRYGVPENVPVLEYERWLLGVLSQVETFNERDVDVLHIARTSLHEEVTVEWARIQGLKRSAWEMQHAFVSPNDSNITPQSETANKQNWIYTGMEALLNRNVFSESTLHDDGIMRDVWDGEVMWNFRASDGTIFVMGDSGEGQYMFSLAMDGFNPFYSKAAGKQVSTGAIYMVCLNLPPGHRYRVKNMFLAGIIPVEFQSIILICQLLFA
ncbi:hypothetical protein WOLCODRAFT_153422 [Wolfiporia cocos MD-104 SS10]|uniref:Uncharacterized protein n=1 Tax=Wolfiporia cocos (strain MD-104) TaxID=742152 RepID=A0A2H3JPE5_WOLCO|nr:hypothetical protein WOLCODRAFT_153422 [Wolfiporia cocos MD-104 SS10]